MAGNQRGITLMQQEFPQISTINIEGYNVFYHLSKKSFVWKIFRQIPKIIKHINAENRWLSRILKEHHFDIVISDNRFGLHNSSVYCIFITHQLHIKSGINKWADRIIQAFNYRYIKRFNECWVPDYAEEINISGELSHGNLIPNNVQYIGILSRFKKIVAEKKYDVLIILSGPEPSRTNWENKLLLELQLYKGRVCFVRGLPEVETSIRSGKNTDIYNHLSGQELNLAIEQSEWVICRSGYTSVMDLVTLRHKAILVPTPGQPEQEYLAKYLYQKKLFYTVAESKFSLIESVLQADKLPFDLNGFLETNKSFERVIEKLTSRDFSLKKDN